MVGFRFRFGRAVCQGSESSRRDPIALLHHHKWQATNQPTNAAPRQKGRQQQQAMNSRLQPTTASGVAVIETSHPAHVVGFVELPESAQGGVPRGAVPELARVHQHHGAPRLQQARPLLGGRQPGLFRELVEQVHAEDLKGGRGCLESSPKAEGEGRGRSEGHGGRGRLRARPHPRGFGRFHGGLGDRVSRRDGV